MKDTSIKGNGKSSIIKAPSDMPETFETWREQLIAGQGYLDVRLNTDVTGANAGCDVVGTPLNKANLLSDTTKAALELDGTDPTVNDALYALKERALPLSGGTLTGNLDITKTIASVVLRTGDSSNRLSGRLMKNANVEGTVDDGIYLTDYGADGSEATLKIQGGQQRLRIKLGGTDYAVYHEGSKPTPADIGAIPFDDSRADIPEGADLNSYTAVGVYRCKNNATAGSLTNSPTTDAFIMDILPSTGTSRGLDGNYDYLIQKIMTNGNRYYARKLSTNGDVSTPIYGAWIEFYTTQNKPTPADIGALQLLTGSYVGTGVSGSSNPNSITFSRVPRLIILLGSRYNGNYRYDLHMYTGQIMMNVIYADQLTTSYQSGFGFAACYHSDSYGKKSSDGKTISWYFDESEHPSMNNKPQAQCNTSGETYYYVALC